MKSQFDFKGVISALPTPFVSDGSNKKIDFKSLTKLVEFQLNNGINGFVVNGTTAESPALSWQEVEAIYTCVRKISGEQVPIILGTGTNSTQQTIDASLKAEALGADAILIVVPYYNKPPQRGLVEHFSATAQATQLPIILYNVPARTITAMDVKTIVKLSEHKNIIAIKEASGDLFFDEELKSQLTNNFIMLSGDDATFLPFLKLGGVGIISVMSNVITSTCVKWMARALEGKFTESEADFKKYKNLISLMYVEANPIPLKWMLYKMGLFESPELRLPLVTLDAQYHDTITSELAKLEII